MRSFLLLLMLAACTGGNVTVSKIDDDGDGYKFGADCDDHHATVNPDAPEVCDGLDNDCDEDVDEEATDGDTFYADTDGDGFGDPAVGKVACDPPEFFVLDNTDCDDTQKTVFPGGTEVCDGLDNDCNGRVDDDPEDLITVYTDADGDGYGDDSTAAQACEAGPGEAEQGEDCNDDNSAIHPGASETDCSDPTDYNCDGSSAYDDVDADGAAACQDCDDQNAAVNPSAPEVCNSIDDDCDGAIDDDDSSLSGAPTWYRDPDGDGYTAGTGLSLTQCETPAGYASATGDCDDYDADSDGYGTTGTTSSSCSQPSGFVSTAGDCDDSRATVYTGATELCDSLDNDCDGSIDEDGQSTWYLDSDSDGYGGTTSSVSCTQPSGYVSTGGDCNDSNAAISPGDVEICDASNTDEDCDNLADNADSSATGTVTYYQDSDNDGYGGTTSQTVCDASSGYISTSGDCNDSNAAISPGDAEVCSDSVDNDCDNSVDEGCVSRIWSGSFTTADYDSKIYGNETGDNFGGSIAAADFNNDGKVDIAVGAEADEYSSTYSSYGTTYIYMGNLNSGVEICTTSDDAFLYSTSSFYTDFGQKLWAIPDMNADGKAELIISADNNGYDWDVLAFRGGSLTGSISYSNDYYDGWNCSDMSGAGDFYAGGSRYLACGYVSSSTATGTVRVYGDASASALVTLNGEASSDHAGASVDFEHDFDGDGVNDAFIGAYGNDSASSNAGAAYVVWGPVSGTFNLSGADFKVTGASSSNNLGQQVASGDLDDDGDPDLIIGAPYYDYGSRSNSGAVYVFTTVGSGTVSATTANWTVYGESSNDLLGAATLSTGDVDDDGAADLLLSSGDDDGGATDAGATWLIYGPLSANWDLYYSYDARWRGEGSYYYAGREAIIAGDTDGDGIDDVLIAGPAADERGYTEHGAVWLFLGG